MPKRKVFDSDEEEDNTLFNAFKEGEDGGKLYFFKIRFSDYFKAVCTI